MTNTHRTTEAMSLPTLDWWLKDAASILRANGSTDHASFLDAARERLKDSARRLEEGISDAGSQQPSKLHDVGSNPTGPATSSPEPSDGAIYTAGSQPMPQELADHIADAGKMVAPEPRDEQIDWMWRWIDRITCGQCSVQEGLSVLTYSPGAPSWVQKIKSSDPLPAVRTAPTKGAEHE